MPKRRRSFGSNDKAGKETPDEATSRKEEQEDDAKPAATAKPESSTSSSLPLLDKNDISENTNNNDNDDNNRGVVVTPHMERLLRLMQQGTTESAQMAAGQLTLLTSQSSAAVLWEILGRLQAMMVSSSSSSMESSWKARQNAAVAMEGVAGNLPVLDQQAFFRTDRNYCHDQTNTSAEDNPSQRSTTTTSLRISDVSIQSVLQQGRELYVAAPSSIAEEWDQAGEAQLQRLDDQQEAAIAATTSKNNCDANDDFVQKRIQKQRRILAQRLGLAAIDDALKSHGATTNGGGNDNPLAGDIVSNADLNATYRSVAAAPKLAKRVRPNKQDKGTTGIQHILVREMNKATRVSGAASHRDPQHLLANELIYRMFDSVWQRRHGALLGILALLKAWRKTLWQQGPTTHEEEGRYFGSWPEDIMARSLCLLALDRFGDFSGAAATDVVPSSDPKRLGRTSEQKIRTASSGVVAPIRELGAQLFSLLWRMAPMSLQQKSLSLLVDMLETTEEWEAQHGSLLAIKYVTIVVSMGIGMSGLGEKNRGWYAECLDTCGTVAGRFLSSTNHDVSGVAARILCEHAAVLFQDDAILHSLWTAVRTTDVMASCVTDVVALLSTFVKSNPGRSIVALANIEALRPGEVSNELVRVLLRFLDCPLASVKVAALTSLDLLSVLKEGGTVDVENMYGNTMRALFQCYIRLVNEMTLSSEDDFTESKTVLAQLDIVWNSYSARVQSANAWSSANTRVALVDLLERYYSSVDALSRPTRYGLLMGAPCTALSNFIQHLVGVAEVEDLVLSSFRLYLSSPFVYHCELACSLLQRLCQSDSIRKRLSLLRPDVNTLFDGTPLCLQVVKNGGCSILEADEMKLRFNARVRSALLRGPQESGSGSSDDEFSSSNIRSLLSRQGHDIDSGDSAIPNHLERMRLRAVAASALLALGPVAKVTPFVRALMTSMKSETSVFRLSETSSALSRLLRSLDSTNPARAKIVNSLSVLISTSEMSEACPSRHAAKAIGTFLGRLPEKDLVLAVSNMKFHAVLQDPSRSPGEVEKALVFFRSLFQSLDSPTCVAYFVRNHVEILCRLSCRDSSESRRDMARSCLRSLCNVDGRGLEVAFPFAARLVDEEKEKDDVLNGSILLKDLCELSPSFLGPFVKMLLPRALKAMTNPDKLVSQVANAIFAILVRVAPLVEDEPFRSARYSGELIDEHTSLIMDHLIRGKKLPRLNLPEEIQGSLQRAGVELRDYQLEGISWISFLLSVNLNGALCDSMGLGKTIQALVGIALAHTKERSPSQISLVVCPATIVNHWVGEVRQFFPGDEIFRPCAVVGDSSSRRKFWSTFDSSKHNLIVLSYGTLRSDIAQVERRKWTFCVLDEGHVLRNPHTATAKASRRVPSRHRLVLSGTMIQNKVLDVWATFDFLMPNFLGSSREFTKTYARPITKSQLPSASADSISEGMEQLRSLHQQVLPFILRREKEQVLKELPPKNVIDFICPLSETQKRFYAVFASSEEAKESLAWFERDFQSENADVGSKVLRVLLFLRLICTHPSLIDMRQSEHGPPPATDIQYDLTSSGKFLALFNLLRDCGIGEDCLMAGDNDESLMYCDNEATAASVTVGTDIPDSTLRVDEAPLNPAIAIADIRRRPKCLVFAQFSQTLDAIEKYLFKPHMPSTRYLRLDGSVASEHRVDVANRFNNDHTISVLLLTTRVGSLGLNLASASTVVFIEHDFNPFVDEQAMDRVHRLGQRANSINIYRLIAADSIDERIMEMQRKKVAVSKAVVNTENSTLYSMGTDRLLDIFTPSSESHEGQQDLEAILTNYAQDYKTLSVDEFIRNFQFTVSSETYFS